MDASLIAGALSSLKAVQDIGASLIGVRDWNLVASKIAEMNGLLLQAQDRVFEHRQQTLALQQQLAEVTDKLRVAEQALAQRGQYTLVEVGDGLWAYRSELLRDGANLDVQMPAQRPHYCCQVCLDGSGKRVVLVRGDSFRGPELSCPACKLTLTPIDPARL